MNKTALVTGSTSGIGHGIAKALAQKGCVVVMSGSRSEVEAMSAIEDVKSVSTKDVYYVQANLLDREGMVGLCTAVDQLCSEGVDILVNNAGMNHLALIEDYPLDKWNDMVHINLTVPFYLCRHFVPGMKKKGWGRIVNISSRMGVVASPRKTPYCATKHGLVGLTKALALETGPFGITCNAVCPGWVNTPFVASQLTEFMEQHGLTREEAEKQKFCDPAPTGKVVQVSQLAELVLFLCSPGGDNMTGTALVMDGGTIAR